MSSGEESCRQSPVVLPGESDRGSSVSSDLQEEYEELLRHAVVMPKWDATRPLPRQRVSSRTVATLTEDQTTPALAMEETTQGRQQHTSSTSENTAPGNDNVSSSVIRQEQRENGSEPRESAPVPVPLASQLLLQTLGRVSPESETGGLTLLGQESHLNQDEVRTQPLLPADKLERVGDILDTWYSNLKRNVLMELGQWMQSMQQAYKKESQEEQERHAAEVGQLHAQLGDLRQLLHTFDKSVKCKDQVISNLTNGLQKEKEKMEKLRAFTHWRLRYADEQQEVFCSRLARQHYHRALTKKVWAAWHSLVEVRWQQRVERACQARAQEVCIQVGNNYEARIIALNEALEEAQGKMEQLQGEREHYNETMKKAFMRGVCALNLEAMSMFQDNERRLEAGVHTAPHFGPPDSRSAGGGGPSDVQFSQQTDFSEGGGAGLAENSCGREQMVSLPVAAGGSITCPMHATLLTEISAPQSHGTAALGAPLLDHASVRVSSDKNPPARVVGGAQQKAGRPASARPSSSFPGERLGRASRTAVEPAARFGRGMVGLAPPMSTVVVERHHPVTKQTVGHATAVRHPRSASVPVGAGASDGKALGGSSAKGGGGGSGGALSSTGAHTIRVVD